jgi:multicomponent Na+:H+ antiporter subunit A
MLTAILVPFAFALAAPVLCRRLGPRSGWILAGAPAIAAWPAVSRLPFEPGLAFVEVLQWAPGFGVSLAFRMDGLAATFALMVTGVGVPLLIYAAGYLGNDPRLGRFMAALLVFQGAMLGVVLADDLITLFVFWELTSISSYVLIGFNHEKAESRAAALKALLVTGGGGLALLAGLVLMAIAGQDLGLAPEAAGRLSALEGVALQGHVLYPAILALIALGAMTKSAQVPFHFWLPAAMAAPTPVSAYLHSATMVKAGIYLLARLHPHLGGTSSWEWAFGSVGAVTMLVAAAMALGQSDLKRILAHSTLAVLGILTMLLGVGTDLAVKTAVVFLVAHALYKAALFMVAGNVDHETGTRDVTVLGGLRRAMPWTAAAGLLAALSKAGAPPMFGFIGKELLYKTKLDLETVGGWLIVAAVLANVALVATALLVSVKPFWGRVRKTPKAPREAPLSMLLGPVVLSVVGLIVGLAPGPFEAALGSATASAILGTNVVMDLKLWHGVNLDAFKVLGLSLMTLGAGVAVYLPLRRALGGTARVVERVGRFGPARLFEILVDAVPSTASRVTSLVPMRRLRQAVMTTVAVTVACVGWLALTEPKLEMVTGPPVGVMELVLVVIAATGAVATLLIRSRLAGVAAVGATGIAVALIFMWYGGPDLAMTQIAVETLSVMVLVLVFVVLPPVVRRSTRWRRVRDGIVAIAVGGLMTVLVLAASSVSGDRPVADFYREASVPEAFGRNIVNVILVDFRAADTLGEITVVAVAALGVAALMAAARRREKEGS